VSYTRTSFKLLPRTPVCMREAQRKTLLKFLPWKMKWKFFKSPSSHLLGFSKDAGGREQEKIAIVTDPQCLGLFFSLHS